MKEGSPAALPGDPETLLLEIKELLSHPPGSVSCGGMGRTLGRDPESGAGEGGKRTNKEGGSGEGALHQILFILQLDRAARPTQK